MVSTLLLALAKTLCWCFHLSYLRVDLQHTFSTPSVWTSTKGKKGGKAAAAVPDRRIYLGPIERLYVNVHPWIIAQRAAASTPVCRLMQRK